MARFSTKPFQVKIAAVLLALGPLLVQACSGQQATPTAAGTKPMSPAEGAADYKDNPMGPHERPPVPTTGGEPTASAPSPGEDPACPPKCSPDGSWVGCGLKKPRGTKCMGCTPKCKAKGSADEGWYDCTGVLIILRPCA